MHAQQEDEEEEEEDQEQEEVRKQNTRKNNQQKKNKVKAIAVKMTEEEKQAKIQELMAVLEGHRSEFCRLHSTSIGYVTTIVMSEFAKYAIRNTTKCRSCSRTLIGHCKGRAYMVNDRVHEPFFLADACFTCHYRLAPRNESCGSVKNMLWEAEEQDSTPVASRYCHVDRSMMPVCRFHVDTHALSVPSFDPVTQLKEMRKFFTRWGFVKARTAATAEEVEAFKDGLVDMLAVMNNLTPDEMRIKMETDHWETDCTWPGAESQEFGNVCEAKDATHASYFTLVQDRRAWETRRLSWPALVPFFNERDNVSSSMAPFVVCPKTEVLSKSFMRSILLNPRAAHEVMQGFYPYVDTRHDTCGISVLVCPEAWDVQKTTQENAGAAAATTTTKSYSFRAMWKGVYPVSFPHGRYPEDCPFNNLPVPIDTELGEVVVVRGERPFRLRASTKNLLGGFVGASNVAPKGSTKEARGDMVLQQQVRMKNANTCGFIFPHNEVKSSTLSLLVPPTAPRSSSSSHGEGDAGGTFQEKWGVRSMSDFVAVAQKMTIADFDRYATQIFGTKHADFSCWPDTFKRLHGGRAPMAVKTDTITDAAQTDKVIIPDDDDADNNFVQRKKKKSGSPRTLDNATTTTTMMNGKAATSESKRDKAMSNTINPGAIVPPTKTKTKTKVGVDMQSLERQAAKHIKGKVKPSAVSPTHVPDDEDDNDDRQVKTVTALTKKKKAKVVVHPVTTIDIEEEEEEEEMQAVPAELPSKKKKKVAIESAAAADAEEEEEDEPSDPEPEAEKAKKKRSRSPTSGGGRAKTTSLPDSLLFDAEDVADALVRKDVPTHLRVNPDFMSSSSSSAAGGHLFSLLVGHLFVAGATADSAVPVVEEEHQESLVTEHTVAIPCQDAEGELSTQNISITSVYVPMNNSVYLQLLDLFAAAGIPSSLEADLCEFVRGEYQEELGPAMVAGKSVPVNKYTRVFESNARLGGRVVPCSKTTPECISQMLTCVNETLIVGSMEKEPFNQVIAITYQTSNAAGNKIKFDQCVPGSLVLVVPLGYSGRILQLRSFKAKKEDEDGDGEGDEENAADDDEEEGKTKGKGPKDSPIMHKIVLVSGMAYCFDASIHENKALKCSLEVQAESRSTEPCSPLTVLFFMTVKDVPLPKGKKKAPAAAAVVPVASASKSKPPPPLPGKKKKKAKIAEDAGDEVVAQAVVKPEPVVAAATKKKNAAPIVPPPPPPPQKKAKPAATLVSGISDEWDAAELKKQYSALYAAVGKEALQSDNTFLKQQWTQLGKAAKHHSQFPQDPKALPRFKTLFDKCYSLAHPAEEEEENGIEPMDLGDDDDDDAPSLMVVEEPEEQKNPKKKSAPNAGMKQATITATMTMKPRSGPPKLPLKQKKPASDDDDDIAEGPLRAQKVVLQGNKLVKRSTREKQAAFNKQAAVDEEALPELERKYKAYARKVARKGLAVISFEQYKHNIGHGKTADSRGLAGPAYGEEADNDDDDDDSDEDGDFDSEHGYGVQNDQEGSDSDDDSDDDIVDDDDDDNDSVSPAERNRLKFHDIASFAAVRLDQFKDATPSLLIGPSKKLIVSEPYDAAYNAISLATRKSTENNVAEMYRAVGKFEHAYKTFMSSDGNPKKARILAQLFPDEEKKKKKKRARSEEEEQEEGAASPSERAAIFDAVVEAGADVSIEGWNPRVPEAMSQQFVMALVDAVRTLSEGNRFCTKMAVFLSKNVIGKASISADVMQRFSGDIWPAAKSVMDQGSTRQNALPVPDDDDILGKQSEATPVAVLDLTADTVLPVPPPPPPSAHPIASSPKAKDIPAAPGVGVGGGEDGEHIDDDDEDEDDEDEEEEEDSLMQQQLLAAAAAEQEAAAKKSEAHKRTANLADVPVAEPMEISDDDDEGESSSTGGGEGEGEAGLDIGLPTPTPAASTTGADNNQQQQQEEEDDEQDSEDMLADDAATAARDGVVVAVPVPPNAKNAPRKPQASSSSLDVAMEPEPSPSRTSGNTLPLVVYQRQSDNVFNVFKTKEDLETTLKKYAMNIESYTTRTAPANWKELCTRHKLPPVEKSLRQLKVSQIFAAGGGAN